jgi:leucyl-tRNA synthetase
MVVLGIDQNISGINRFVNQFKEWMKQREVNDTFDIESFKKKIFGYTESFRFNKVVSEYMTLVNKETH